MVRTQQEIAAVHPDPTFVHVDAGFLYDGETTPVPRQVLDERRFLAARSDQRSRRRHLPARAGGFGEHGVTDRTCSGSATTP